MIPISKRLKKKGAKRLARTNYARCQGTAQERPERMPFHYKTITGERKEKTHNNTCQISEWPLDYFCKVTEKIVREFFDEDALCGWLNEEHEE